MAKTNPTKSKPGSRISTFQWVKKWMAPQTQREAVVECLEKYFDSNAQVKESQDNDNSNGRDNIHKQPINILCLDGGGSRGNAHLAMFEALSQKLGGQKNILSYFDLVGGSSVGGVTVITCNYVNGNMDDACCICYESVDAARKQVFKRLKIWNLFTKGRLERREKEDDVTMLDIFINTAGTETPLYNPNAMKAFPLATEHTIHDKKDNNDFMKRRKAKKMMRSNLNPMCFVHMILQTNKKGQD